MTNAPEQPGARALDGDAGASPPAQPLPIPGNAEFALFALIEIVLILIWIIAESVNTYQWCVFTGVLTSFYFISRGIAKASRVLEQ